jgi:hypothetical protein
MVFQEFGGRRPWENWPETCTPRPSCWVNNLHELGHMSISTLRINGDPVLFA